jgi:hypothetical protein
MRFLWHEDVSLDRLKEGPSPDCGRILECFKFFRLVSIRIFWKQTQFKGFCKSISCILKMGSTKRNQRNMARLATLGLVFIQVNGQSILIPSSPPVGASQPVGEAFVSLSFEFGSFPTYAGNKSAPNQLTGNLLDNIARYQGTRPYIRVGGVTQ